MRSSALAELAKRAENVIKQPLKCLLLCLFFLTITTDSLQVHARTFQNKLTFVLAFLCWSECYESVLDSAYWTLCSSTKKSVWLQVRTQSQEPRHKGNKDQMTHTHTGALSVNSSGTRQWDTTQCCSIRFQQHLPQIQYREDPCWLQSVRVADKLDCNYT